MNTNLIRMIALLSIATFLVAPLGAQYNTFPSDGNVGVGTTTPVEKFQVNSGNIAHLASGTMGDAWSQWTNIGTRSYPSFPLYLGSNRYGLGIVWESDGAFFGLSRESYNRCDAIIAWGDDSDDNLRFLFNGTERARLTASGNLKLPTIEFHADNGVTPDQPYFRGTGSHLVIAPGYQTGGTMYYSYPCDLASGAGVNTRIQETLYISTTGSGGRGYVGVCTDAPQAYLHVRGTRAFGSLRLSPTNDEGEAALAFFQDAAGTDVGRSWVVGQGCWGNPGKYVVGNQVAGGPILTVVQTGNVGIGTTSPTHKLSVNGTIKAREVIVETTGWADDVFAPGYALPTLETVARHIAEKGHLPGVPSAAEVAEQGVSVGEMQAALLRKVEELTLYMIEARSELATTRAENAELRRRLEALEASR